MFASASGFGSLLNLFVLGGVRHLPRAMTSFTTVSPLFAPVFGRRLFVSARTRFKQYHRREGEGTGVLPKTLSSHESGFVMLRVAFAPASEYEPMTRCCSRPVRQIAKHMPRIWFFSKSSPALWLCRTAFVLGQCPLTETALPSVGPSAHHSTGGCFPADDVQRAGRWANFLVRHLRCSPRQE